MTCLFILCQDQEISLHLAAIKRTAVSSPQKWQITKQNPRKFISIFSSFKAFKLLKLTLRNPNICIHVKVSFVIFYQCQKKKYIYIYIYICVFFNFWLRWVFAAACRLSLVAVSGGHPSSRCVGLPLQWPLLLRSMGSRHAGFSSCGTLAQ